MPAHWTDDEISILEKGVEADLSPESMTEELNRSASSIRAKIKALQSKNRKIPWTVQDVETLKALANKQCSIEVMSLKMGRSPQAIKAKLDYEWVVENAQLELGSDERRDYKRLQTLESEYRGRGFITSIVALLFRTD